MRAATWRRDESYPTEVTCQWRTGGGPPFAGSRIERIRFTLFTLCLLPVATPPMLTHQ